MDEFMISIQLKQNQVSPGQILQGDCYWQTNSDKDFQAATLTIGWRTEGRGNVDKDQFSKKIKLASLVSVPFEYEIPLNAPLSYDGQLIRIIWEVVVELDQFWFGREKGEKLFRVSRSATR
jgi:hypothetical protein